VDSQPTDWHLTRASARGFDRVLTRHGAQMRLASEEPLVLSTPLPNDRLAIPRRLALAARTKAGWIIRKG
jgi:hypothetical protein